MGKEELKEHLFALILCGGGGTRLWPRSREKTPKQFSRLLGKQTLFQKTVARLNGLLPVERIFVVTTTKEYAQEVKKETPQIPNKNIIWEPIRRNTALAHGLGALIIKKIDPQAVIINLYSDHLIQKEAEFKKTELAAAMAAGSGNYLVAIGIKPAGIHTGLGHIKAKKIIKKWGKIPIYKLEKFIEKPDYETAKKFMVSGDYYWNAGMYVWSANSYLLALKKHAPKTYQALIRIEKNLGTRDERKVMKKAYQEAPDISVDYAVSEKAKNFLMVPAEIGWTDIGDWRIVYNLSPKDEEGNVVIKFGEKGEFIGIGAKNNLVHFDDQLIVAVGVENLIIVDTTDAILICHKDKAEKVKKAVQLLKKKNKIEYL